MQRIEQQPKEIRIAYVMDELKRIAERAETEEQAKEDCEERLRELAEQKIIPNNQDDVQPIIVAARELIKNRFNDEDKAEEYGKKGRYLFIEEQYDLAIAAFKTAIKFNNEDSRSRLLLCRALCKLERIEEALEVYEESIRISPTYLLYSELGSLYEKLERYEDATKAYQEAILLKPDSGSYVKLLDIYEKMGKLKEALEICNMIVELDPTPYIYRRLAEIHRKLGNIEFAAQAYEEALCLLPDYDELMGELASLYVELGRSEEALELYKKAIEKSISFDIVSGDSKPYILGLVKLYKELGRHKDIIELIDSVIDKCGTLVGTDQSISELKYDPEYFYILAEAYKALGDISESERAMEEAQKIEIHTPIDYDPRKIIDEMLEDF